MKTINCVLLVLSVLLLGSCKSGNSASNNAATAGSTGNSNTTGSARDANNNASRQADAIPAPNPNEPAQLIGTYESREVHDQGVVTLMSQLKTLWNFTADGTYQRRAEVKGKPYHADSGTFRIESPDKLVLTIQASGVGPNRKIQNPPLTKTHKFSLSPNGDELRLTSEKGSIGIFERIAKPQPR
ncbi:MAG TPA: hypothetical protein VFF31_26330 [Blastocatellia bacterium]|nr:hypothetical protein [Blastocatellia bacterium]